MALLSVIRRWHFRDYLSIREIARRTGLSRSTIHNYLRSDTVAPQFKAPDRPSKLAHSLKLRLVVMMTLVRSWSLLSRWKSSAPPEALNGR